MGSSASQAEVRRFATTQIARWANGNGETRELRAWPSGDEHAWRLSIATISSDEPFSHFAGVDRALMALSPDGVSLRFEHTTVALKQYEAVSFSGEERVAPVGVLSPSADLNFFVPRGNGTPSLGLANITQPTAIHATALVALEGHLWFHDAELRFGDSVFDADNGDAGTFLIHGEGLVAIAATS